MGSTYCITPNNELYHYGVKGMKWGVRRFQKKDGSLTLEGKARNEAVRRMKKVATSQVDIDNIQSTFSKKERKLMGLDTNNTEVDEDENVVNTFINKVGDIPVAYFQLTDVGAHMNASVGTRNGSEYRSKGHASKCIKSGLDWYAKNSHKFGNKPIVWWAEKENIASQKTAERNGFKKDLSIEKSDDEWLKNNWVKYIYE